MEFEKISGVLKVLGHPVRLEIVSNLMVDECNVNSIVKRLDLPQSTVSQHLQKLQDKGIITPRKNGVITCYRVTDEKVRELVRLFKD